MEPRFAKRCLLYRIKKAAGKLESLSPWSGIDLMLAFYEEVRAKGCVVKRHDDMLLYQYGTYDWFMGEGEWFEFDITRQLIKGVPSDDNIKQLSLTFKFKPTKAVRNLHGGRWCDSPKKLESFPKIIERSEGYRAVGNLRPDKVELDYEGV